MSPGNWKRAYVALRHLVKHLASSNMSEEQTKMSSDVISSVPLSDYLEGLLSSHSSNKLFQWSGDSASVTSSSELQNGLSQYTSNWGYDASNTSPLSRSEFSDFTEAIERLYESSSITKIEKMQALAIIDLLQEVSNPHSTSAYGSLDEPGRRYF